MRYITRLSLLLCFSIAATTSLLAQVNQEFSISKISIDYVKTPDFSTSIGPKKNSKSQDWLEVEVEFDWNPRTTSSQEPVYVDELTFNYYVLLNNKNPKNPKGTLLIGQVTHTAIAPGKGMRSVMYVSPHGMVRLFNGKTPSTALTAVQDVGITISRQGQIVASKNWKYKGPEQWWSTLQQTPGFLLNKTETPFAPLFWDYYEAIKPKS